MKIYLIRHAHPSAQDGLRRCISQTDLPLDALGEAQARGLAAWLKAHPVSVIYTSPLLRCRQTAQHMAGHHVPTRTVDRLTEMGVGLWENLSFDEIRSRWPKAYALRGMHMGTTAPPGGESFLEAGRRLGDFLSSLPDMPGDVAVVSHGGILRGWLCPVLGVSPDDILSIRQPWSGITTVCREHGVLSVSSVGLCPSPVPSDEEIEAFYAACCTPQDVQAHCRAVSACAQGIAEESSIPLNPSLLRAAALVHDLCRTQGRDHPQAAAQRLDAAGYPLLADLVARHHDPGEAASPEAEVLFLADKLIQGTTPVTLDARFEQSKEKCRDALALAAWRRRYDAAAALERKYCHDNLL
ncbi:MAG: histidine phosphatase family protein [Candidatus Ventricola sp.]